MKRLILASTLGLSFAVLATGCDGGGDGGEESVRREVPTEKAPAPGAGLAAPAADENAGTAPEPPGAGG